MPSIVQQEQPKPKPQASSLLDFDDEPTPTPQQQIPQTVQQPVQPKNNDPFDFLGLDIGGQPQPQTQPTQPTQPTQNLMGNDLMGFGFGTTPVQPVQPVQPIQQNFNPGFGIQQPTNTNTGSLLDGGLLGGFTQPPVSQPPQPQNFTFDLLGSSSSPSPQPQPTFQPQSQPTPQPTLQAPSQPQQQVQSQNTFKIRAFQSDHI